MSARKEKKDHGKLEIGKSTHNNEILGLEIPKIKGISVICPQKWFSLMDLSITAVAWQILGITLFTQQQQQ